MLKTLAIANYRSLLNLVVPLGRLNLVVGPNGSGKSNLYRALRLLAETAQGGVITALAKEGGLGSTLWAGPEKVSKRMRSGEVPIQGTQRRHRVRMRMGFTGDDFSYAISLGLPKIGQSYFGLDPEIKSECIWVGNGFHPAAVLVHRKAAAVKIHRDNDHNDVLPGIASYDSIFSEFADPVAAPEILSLREHIRGWRFYDHFRTDENASPRLPQIGTRTPVLSQDGHDLAAALRTIIEIGDHDALHAAVSDAFPGARLGIDVHDSRFTVSFQQEGLLRPLSAAELSDGTLRYLLWVAALLTPRPPTLMVLNEPETSLHPDLLPALARLITKASEETQVWVVSHAQKLIAELKRQPSCHPLELTKDCGETQLVGQELLDRPRWQWPDKE